MKNNPSHPIYEVAIIGAGFGGIATAIRLKQLGKTSFVILEKAKEVGGTWRDNTYPGCACDVPSHLYSFSFALNPKWSRMFSGQKEILAYLKSCVAKHGLETYIRYQTEVVRLEFVEDGGYWQVTNQNGTTLSAKVIVSATGPLNRVHIPKLPGMENFMGKAFHSAQWDSTFDWTGKEIAVIGTGASAVQMVPAMAPKVGQLFLFQRTAPWVTPRLDRNISKIEKSLFSGVPMVQHVVRSAQYWTRELIGLAFFGNIPLRRLATFIAIQHIKKGIKDPTLRQKVTPQYEIGCKRVLVSDDYYPALARPNVELVTQGIANIKANSIVTTDGQERKVDAIIYGTGFVAAELLLDMDVLGLGGRNLRDEWKAKSVEAYYGMTVSGFPNLLMLLGPNSGLGHNSVVHMIESQVNYLIDYLKTLEALGAEHYLDVKLESQEAFNKKIQAELNSRSVWATGGCSSWYYDSKGKNTTLWSGLTVRYRRETKTMIKVDYTPISATDKN